MTSQAHDRRSQIIAAARELANLNGLPAITVRAVSAHAGIGVGTLRHYFPSQRELFDAVVVDMVDNAIDVSVVMDPTVPAGDRLAHAMLQLLPAALDNRPILDGWFGLYSSSLGASPNAATRQLLETSTAQSHRNVRIWLGYLTESGVIDAAAIDDTANTLIALVTGLALEAATPGSPITIPVARGILESAVRGTLSIETSHGDPS